MKLLYISTLVKNSLITYFFQRISTNQPSLWLEETVGLGFQLRRSLIQNLGGGSLVQVILAFGDFDLWNTGLEMQFNLPPPQPNRMAQICWG